MELYDAKVADILRCSQRDAQFVNELQDSILSLLKLFGVKNYNKLRKVVPVLANSWYYSLTSLSNLQTLGEEYAGILRLNSINNIPAKLLQILWLGIYLGGEPLVDRLLEHLKITVSTSESLTEQARQEILRWVKFIKDNKHVFLRLHLSWFYIFGKFYNVSNRLAGIKYVLLRQWLQDDSSTGSFRLLGKLSMLYLLLNLLNQCLTSKKQFSVMSAAQIPSTSESTKICILCAENRKNTSVTPCGHLFCWECIYDSLNYQQNCPVCREIINPSRIVLLQNYV